MQSRDRVRRKVFDWADDLLAGQDLFALLGNALPKRAVTTSDMWYDGGDYILCRTADVADAAADWLKEHGNGAVYTGYFDPESLDDDDYESKVIGWYFVST